MEVYPVSNQFASPFHVGRYPLQRRRVMEPEQHTVDREAETAESLDEVSTVPRDEQTAARPHLLILYYPPETASAFVDKFPKQRLRKLTNQTLRMGRGEGVDVLLNDIHMPRAFAELSCRIHPEEGPKWCVKNKSNKKPIRIEYNNVKTSLKHEEEKELQDYCQLKLETLRFLVKTEEGDVGELTEFELEILPMEGDSASSGSSFRSLNRQTSSSDETANSITSAAALNRQRTGSGRSINQNRAGVAQTANHFGLPLHTHGGLPGSQMAQQLTQAPDHMFLTSSQASTCCNTNSQCPSQQGPSQQFFHNPHVCHPVGHHFPPSHFSCGHQGPQMVNSPIAGQAYQAPPGTMNSASASSHGSQLSQSQTHVMYSQQGGYTPPPPAHGVNNPALNPQGSGPSQLQAPMTGHPSSGTGYVAPASGPPYHHFHGGGGVAPLGVGNVSGVHPHAPQAGVAQALNQQLAGVSQPARGSPNPYQQAASRGQVPDTTHALTQQGLSGPSQYGALPPQFSNQQLPQHFSAVSQVPSQQPSAQLPPAQQMSAVSAPMGQAPFAMPELLGTSLQPHSSMTGYPGLSAHSQQPWAQHLHQQHQNSGAGLVDQPLPLCGPQSFPGPTVMGQAQQQQPSLYTERLLQQSPAYITQPESAAAYNLEVQQQQQQQQQQRPTPVISNPTSSDRNPQLYIGHSGYLPAAPPTTQLDNLRLGFPVQVTESDSTDTRSVAESYPVQVSMTNAREATTVTPANSLSHSGSGSWNASAGQSSQVHPHHQNIPQGSQLGGGEASPSHPPVANLSSLTNPAANGNTVRLRGHDAIAATPPPSSDFSTMGSVQLHDLQAIDRVQQGQGQGRSPSQGREPQENDERQPQEHDDQQN